MALVTDVNLVNIIEATDTCCRDFTISYLATDDTGEDVYLSLLSDWDLDAAFFSASTPCLRLKVDLKPFEPGTCDLFMYLKNLFFYRWYVWMYRRNHLLYDYMRPSMPNLWPTLYLQ